MRWPLFNPGKHIYPPAVVLLLILLGCTKVFGFSSAVNVVPDQVSELAPPLALYYYFDPDDSLQVQDILAQSGEHVAAWGKWQPMEVDAIREFEKKPYWFLVTIKNDSDNTRLLMLDYPYPRIPMLDVFFVKGGVVESRFETGYRRPISSRAVHYINFAFPLVLEPRETVDVILKTSLWSHSIPDKLQLFDQAVFYDRYQAWLSVGYLFYGVMIAIIFYNLLIFRYSSDRVLLVFAIFVVTMLLAYSASSGYWQLYFPNVNPDILHYATQVVWGCAFLAAIYFASYFLEFKRFIPRVDKWLKVVTWIAVLGVQFALLNDLRTASATVLFILVVTTYLVPVCIAFYLLRRNTKSSLIFILSWLPYIVLITIRQMNLVGMVEIPTLGMFEAAQALQCFIFSAALGNRIAVMQADQQKAKAESRAKGEFMALMSHEIRTPMNAVLGMSELLKSTSLNRTQARYNDVIYSAGSALLTIINDILDFSKISAGKMTIESLAFNVRAFSQETLMIFKNQANEKGVELICDIHDDVPQCLCGDPNRLRQILVNLVGNALKFTEQGEIRLAITVDPKREGRLLFSVADTGAGITDEQQKILFQDFVQADKSIARKYGGTGLGLSICKKLVELMNGDIGVHSELGGGAKFWFSIPMLAADDPQSLSGDFSLLKGKRLLVVDDNRGFADFIAENAERWGMSVDVAHSGQQAVMMVSSCATGEAYDIISLDLKIPDMSGLAVARELKKGESSIPSRIILVTALTDLPDLNLLRENGVEEVLEKPVMPDELATAFVNLLRADVGSVVFQEEHAAQNESPEQKLSVLVADDNKVNQMVIKGMLEKLGHDVVLKMNGRETVDAFMADPDSFDVILMDCDMPVLDGWMATSLLRTWERQQNREPIPIVALTAHVMEEQIQRCEEVGMNGHLTKPISVNALRECLANTVLVEVAAKS